MEIYREMLCTDVERHVGYYITVAQKRKSTEMFSPLALGQFRDRLQMNLKTEIDGLKFRNQTESYDDSAPSDSMLPAADDYLRLEAEILVIVDAQIHMMRPETEN